MAVQSHFFGVGSVVSWAEAGVGAVATQSLVEPAFGPRGLELMRDGSSAPAALQQMIGTTQARRCARWRWWTAAAGSRCTPGCVASRTPGMRWASR